MKTYTVSKVLSVPSGTTTKTKWIKVQAFETEGEARIQALKLVQQLQGKWGVRVVISKGKTVVVSYAVGGRL